MHLKQRAYKRKQMRCKSSGAQVHIFGWKISVFLFSVFFIIMYKVCPITNCKICLQLKKILYLYTRFSFYPFNYILQTNSKAQMANELDNLRRKEEKYKEEQAKTTSELAGLRYYDSWNVCYI